MLKSIDQNLWVAEQPLKFFGLEVGTRMTVIRLNDGNLMVISPIQLEKTTIEQLNQLGQVSTIIAPNLFHHLFLENFQQCYPDAKLWATAGLEQKCPHLKIDHILQEEVFEELETTFVTGFNTLLPQGFIPLKEWVFFHAQTRTLILTDTAFHFDSQSSATAQLLTKLFGGYNQLRPSFLEKLATQDKEQVRQSIQRILEWDFDRVIMAHGSILDRDGKHQFQVGYEWFLGMSL